MAYKVSVKWINGRWQSFSKTCSHFSAGITEIVDLVEEELAPHLEAGQRVEWRATDNALIATVADKPIGKISKRDQE